MLDDLNKVSAVATQQLTKVGPEFIEEWAKLNRKLAHYLKTAENSVGREAEAHHSMVLESSCVVLNDVAIRLEHLANEIEAKLEGVNQ